MSFIHLKYKVDTKGMGKESIQEIMNAYKNFDKKNPSLSHLSKNEKIEHIVQERSEIGFYSFDDLIQEKEGGNYYDGIINVLLESTENELAKTGLGTSIEPIKSVELETENSTTSFIFPDTFKEVRKEIENKDQCSENDSKMSEDSFSTTQLSQRTEGGFNNLTGSGFSDDQVNFMTSQMSNTSLKDSYGSENNNRKNIINSSNNLENNSTNISINNNDIKKDEINTIDLNKNYIFTKKGFNNENDLNNFSNNSQNDNEDNNININNSQNNNKLNINNNSNLIFSPNFNISNNRISKDSSINNNTDSFNLNTQSSRTISDIDKNLNIRNEEIIRSADNSYPYSLGTSNPLNYSNISAENPLTKTNINPSPSQNISHFQPHPHHSKKYFTDIISKENLVNMPLPTKFYKNIKYPYFIYPNDSTKHYPLVISSEHSLKNGKKKENKVMHKGCYLDKNLGQYFCGIKFKWNNVDSQICQPGFPCIKCMKMTQDHYNLSRRYLINSSGRATKLARDKKIHCFGHFLINNVEKICCKESGFTCNSCEELKNHITYYFTEEFIDKIISGLD